MQKGEYSKNKSYKIILTYILNIIFSIALIFFIGVFSLYAANMIYSRSAFHITMVPVLIILLALLPVILRKQIKRFIGRFYTPMKIFVTLTLVLFSISFGMFYRYVSNYSKLSVEAFVQTNPNEKVAVMVFGCRVYEHGPSEMLALRLLKARDILVKYPDSIVIVSGGQGVDEHDTEASVMRDYLMAKGIEEDRIFLEEDSRSTMDNINFTMKLIEELEISDYRLVGVSSDFHIPRIELFAKNKDFDITMVPSKSYVMWSMMGNILREYLALCKAIIFDLR